jgi:hypothetical protein
MFMATPVRVIHRRHKKTASLGGFLGILDSFQSVANNPSTASGFGQ